MRLIRCRLEVSVDSHLSSSAVPLSSHRSLPEASGAKDDRGVSDGAAVIVADRLRRRVAEELALPLYLGLPEAPRAKDELGTDEMRALLVGMLAIARYPLGGWRVQQLKAGWTFGEVRKDR